MFPTTRAVPKLRTRRNGRPPHPKQVPQQQRRHQKARRKGPFRPNPALPLPSKYRQKIAISQENLRNRRQGNLIISGMCSPREEQ